MRFLRVKLIISLFILIFTGFSFSFGNHGLSVNKNIEKTKIYANAILGNTLPLKIWSNYQKEWFKINTKELLERQAGIGLSEITLDLSVDNDIIYKVNKEYFEKQLKEKEELKKNIDTILSKIKTKQQKVENVDAKYLKYIEIEDAINKADFVYVLSLPIDKFLFVEDDDGNKKIIITRDPIIQDKIGEDNAVLHETIRREVNEIINEGTIRGINEKINFFKEKFDRDYSSLFIEKSMQQFYNDIHINVAYKDNMFIQNYQYPNKLIMNSIEYLPNRLSGLEGLTNDSLLVYVPISLNNSVSNLLKGLKKQTMIYKNSPEFCFKISYNDANQFFEDYFCNVSSYFGTSKVKVKQIEMSYNNNFYITIGKLGFVSVLLQLLILIAFLVAPVFIIKYVDNITNFGSKFETEDL